MNARSTSRVNVRPTFFCAGARDPSGSLGGPPLNAADGPKAARLLERCAAGPQLLSEVERPVFVALDDRLWAVGSRPLGRGLEQPGYLSAAERARPSPNSRGGARRYR